jgi:DNA-binding transcriptional LysR family regulator
LSASSVHNRALCDYPIGFLASPALGLGGGTLTVHDLAKFPIITFPRKTQPYEIVRSLFNRPDLPPIRLHASASLATVIHMAIEGLGIAVIPTAIVENELADGRLQLLATDLKISPLTFSASWLESPDTVAVELVAGLAGQIARGSALVDAPPSARH